MSILHVTPTFAEIKTWVRAAATAINQLITGKQDQSDNLDSIAGLALTGNAGDAIVVKATEDGFELAAGGGGGGGTTTNALTINNGGAGAASGATFNGSAAVTISYNTVGAAASSHNHDSDYVQLAGDTMTGDLIVPDEAYGSGWNGSLEVPTKNAVYDKIESLPSGWDLVASGTASASANVDLLVDSSAYTEWMLIGRGVKMSGANELALQVGTGGTPTYDTGNNYDFGIEWRYGTAGAGTFSRALVSATANIRLGTVASASSTSGVNHDFDCLIRYLASGDPMRVINGESSYDGGGGLTRVTFDGVHNNSAYDVSGLRIVPSAGTITSGTFALFGRSVP